MPAGSRNKDGKANLVVSQIIEEEDENSASIDSEDDEDNTAERPLMVRKTTLDASSLLFPKLPAKARKSVTISSPTRKMSTPVKPARKGSLWK